MYVYFIRANGHPKRLKIGKASDPLKRLKSLQTGSGHRLTLAGAIKCKSNAHALHVEKAFHLYFAKERQDGEWFRCTDYVLSQVWDILTQLTEQDSDIKALSARELEILHSKTVHKDKRVSVPYWGLRHG